MKTAAPLLALLLSTAAACVAAPARADDAPAVADTAAPSAPTETAAPSASTAAASTDTRWTPAAWAGEDTLQFRTDCPGEGEYWSYVWLVVLDGNVWVRLGSRAAGRVDCSATKTTTSVRIAGEQFDDVEMVDTPAMSNRVAAAMADKYSTDIFVRYMTHPYTMRLLPKR